MRTHLRFLIFVTLVSVGDASDPTDSIVKTLAEAGTRADNLSPSNCTLESNETIAGIKFSVAKVVEKGRIVQIGWAAHDLTNKSVLTQTYSTLIKTLKDRRFEVISSSVAVDGTVVVGNPMTHSNKGVSFWVSLLDRERKLRVDLDYQLKSDNTPERWKIAISTDAFIPE